MRVLLVVIVFLCCVAPLHAEHVHEDERLRIRGNVPEAWIATAAELGKALYPALEKHFGTAPGAAELPLQLVLYADKQAFAKAMRDAGHRDPKHEGSGGFTDWTKGISRVWLQADAFHTRRLVLHELFHQFHDKCQDPSRRGQGAFWYREGLAEWFGWHRRTEDGIQFGAIDVIARGGTRHAVRARMQEKNIYPAWDFATGKERAGYADALCLVGAFLGTKDEELKTRFRAWERDILRRGGGTKSFERAFDGMQGDVASAVRIFWQYAPLPWETTSAGWDERGGVVSGESAQEITAWSPAIRWTAASVSVVLGSGRAGLSTRPIWRGSRFAAVIEKDRMMLVRKDPKAGSWKIVASRSAKTSGELRLSLAVDQEEGRATFTLVGPEGRAVLEVASKKLGFEYAHQLGHLGLIVRRGSARFRDFRIDERY